MNKLASNICVGCIGGLYAGLILMSLFLLLFTNSTYHALDILEIYAYAMIIGTVLGGLVCFMFCKK